MPRQPGSAGWQQRGRHASLEWRRLNFDVSAEDVVRRIGRERARHDRQVAAGTRPLGVAMDERATTNDHHSSPVRRLARRHPIAMFLVIALSLSLPVMIAFLVSGRDGPPQSIRIESRERGFGVAMIGDSPSSDVRGELGAVASRGLKLESSDSWASSGGFGKARGARWQVQQPGYLEACEPDPGGGDANADGEGSDHPTTMVHDVVATDGPDRKHQARQEPQPEHHRGRGLQQAAK